MIQQAKLSEIDIMIPAHWNDKVIIKTVEAACKGLGLIQRSRLYWVKHIVRWQVKMEKQKGSLEISYLPPTKRAWFTVRKNRYAEWIDTVIPRLKTDIERRLTGPRSKVRG
jgi:hypothetical protein